MTRRRTSAIALGSGVGGEAKAPDPLSGALAHSSRCHAQLAFEPCRSDDRKSLRKSPSKTICSTLMS